MKRSIPILGLTAMVLATICDGLGAQAPRGDEESAVRTAVQAYFDGITKHDVDALGRAFFPRARFMYVRPDGSVYESSFEDWSSFAQRPASPEGKQNTLISIDVTGSAAVAKTELFWPGVHYVDYLSMLRIAGEWRIVQKIWWQEPTQGAAPARELSSRGHRHP